MTIYSVSATDSQSLSATSYTTIPSSGDEMAKIPASGNYLAIFSAEIFAGSSASDGDDTTFGFAKNGTVDTYAIITREEDVSITSSYAHICGHCLFPSLSGSDEITVDYIATSASTPYTIYNRELILYPYSGTVYQDEGTSFDAATADVWQDLATVSPASGTDYLLAFTATVAVDQGWRKAEFRVKVNSVVIDHTLRANQNEGSEQYRERIVNIFCKIPDPAGDVVVEYRTVNTNSDTGHEYLLSLIPVDSGDIYEASSSTKMTQSSGTDTLITSMDITPSADEYLVLFSGWDFISTTGTTSGRIAYTARSNGSTVTNSRRYSQHESSIDNAEVAVAAGWYIDHSAGDIEIWWQPYDTTTVEINDRTLVLVKEAAAAAGGLPSGSLSLLGVGI